MNVIEARLSDRQLLDILALSADATAIYTSDNIVVEMANDAMLGFFGKGRSIIGKPLIEAVPEFAGQLFIGLLQQVWRTGITYEAKAMPVRMNIGGELKTSYYDLVYRAIKSPDGTMLCILNTATDVTGRVLTEQTIIESEFTVDNLSEELAASNEELKATIEELRQSQDELSLLNSELEDRVASRTAALAASERRFKSILNALPQIAWTSTPRGEINFFNQRWYDYTRFTVEQTRGAGWEAAIHPDDLPFLVNIHNAIAASKQPGEIEVRKKDAAGNYRWHLVRIQPAYNERGQIEHLIGTATDIDAIKQLQQQKDDFISIASHELKTPITSLKASLQLIDRMRDQKDKELLPRLILQSRRSIQRVSTLVEDLLNVSRLQQGEVYLNKTNFILSQLLNACCSPISIMGKHKVSITGDLELEVYADEHRIDQVVVNLVNNAVKYAPDSELIVLDVKREGNLVKVSVTDTGPGIPEEKTAHLFDRYYRVNSAGNQGSGLGLGLYISAEIIKRHGGKMGVESQQGKGSCFWFTLPIEG